MIDLILSGQELMPRTAPKSIATDSVGQVCVNFERGEDWRDYLLTVQFTTCGKTYSTQIGEMNSCYIPIETAPPSLEISVFGVKGNTRRNVTKPIILSVVKSGYNPNGETPMPPTPDLYNQLVNQVTNAWELSEAAANGAENSARAATQSVKFAEEFANYAAKAAKKASDAVVNPPKIVDGTWHVWQQGAGYTDTGISAHGLPGKDGAKGEPGAKGEKGDPGERGLQGLQGIPGESGQDGADGHTPEKGVDYFTEADKTAMVEAVLNALPVAEGEGLLMAKIAIEEITLSNIGNAIRAKSGDTDLIPPEDMPAAIREEFLKCVDKLDSLIDGNVTEVDSEVVQVRAYVFRDCGKLIRASFPKLNTVPSNAFALCKQLAEVKIPAATAIEGTAFYRCEALKTLDLPMLSRLGGTQALFRCESLSTLILRNTELCTLSSADSLSRTLIESGTGYIYVPAALLEEYKTATNWVVYANQFRAIEDYPEICEL